MSRPQTVSDGDIVAAARAVFLELGPAASVNVVAERLGVSHAALFHRVGSKDALFVEALSQPPPAFVTERWPSPELGEPFEKHLVARLCRLMAFLKEVIPALVMLRASGKAVRTGAEPPHAHLRQQLARHLTAAAKQGLCDVSNASVVAEGIFGALEARCFNLFIGGEVSSVRQDRAFVRRLVRTFVVPSRPESSES